MADSFKNSNDNENDDNDSLPSPPKSPILIMDNNNGIIDATIPPIAAAAAPLSFNTNKLTGRGSITLNSRYSTNYSNHGPLTKSNTIVTNNTGSADSDSGPNWYRTQIFEKKSQQNVSQQRQPTASTLCAIVDEPLRNRSSTAAAVGGGIRRKLTPGVGLMTSSLGNLYAHTTSAPRPLQQQQQQQQSVPPSKPYVINYGATSITSMAVDCCNHQQQQTAAAPFQGSMTIPSHISSNNIRTNQQQQQQQQFGGGYPSSNNNNHNTIYYSSHHKTDQSRHHHFSTYELAAAGGSGQNLVNNSGCHNNRVGTAAAVREYRHLDGSLRGILRNKDEFVNVKAGRSPNDQQECDVEDFERVMRSGSKWKRFNRYYLRPVLSEFVSVFFYVYVINLFETSLRAYAAVDKISRILIVSVVEAALYALFLFTFEASCSVQVSPAVSLGALFSGICPPFLCVINLFVQLAASFLSVLLFQISSTEGSPVLPTLPPTESKEEWLMAVYRLVLCQTVANALTVLTYLTAFTSYTTDNDDSRRSQLGGNQRSPPGRTGGIRISITGVPFSIAIGSFLSLINSSASWNPIRSLSTCLAVWLLKGSLSVFHWHYILWMGPIIGSLFASVFYRLVFTGSNTRPIRSSCHETGVEN